MNSGWRHTYCANINHTRSKDNNLFPPHQSGWDEQNCRWGRELRSIIFVIALTCEESSTLTEADTCVTITLRLMPLFSTLTLHVVKCFSEECVCVCVWVCVHERGRDRLSKLLIPCLNDPMLTSVLFHLLLSSQSRTSLFMLFSSLPTSWLSSSHSILSSLILLSTSPFPPALPFLIYNFLSLCFLSLFLKKNSHSLSLSRHFYHQSSTNGLWLFFSRHSFYLQWQQWHKKTFHFHLPPGCFNSNDQSELGIGL